MLCNDLLWVLSTRHSTDPQELGLGIGPSAATRMQVGMQGF